MIRINLLPPEERQPRLPLPRIFLLVTLIVSLFMVSIYFYTVFSIWNLEKQIAETENQYELLKPTRDAMQTAAARQQVISAKNSILLGLTKERQSWYALTTHLGMVTIPQVWLSEIGVAEENTLHIKGASYTYPDLAAYLKVLAQDEMFQEPVLVNAERDGATGATKFEITVKLKGR
ncbi:MAG: PilN domain-containing protein [Veillonellales bacterium]